MTSKSRETRLKQKAEWEGKLQKRLALLGAKGFDEKKIARDVGVKELKAKIKESQVRLRAIDANEKRTAELAAIKAERLAKPKEEAPKAKKQEEPPPEDQTQEEKEEEGGRRRASTGVAPPAGSGGSYTPSRWQVSFRNRRSGRRSGRHSSAEIEQFAMEKRSRKVCSIPRA